MFDKSEYMKQYRLEHPEVMQRFLKKHPNYKKEHNLVSNKKWSPIYNPRRINFKGKGQILLDHNPRTGQCSKCGKHGLTHIHHRKYDEHDLLKYTIELCASCHGKEHRKKK